MKHLKNLHKNIKFRNYYLLIESFSRQFQLMVFHWSLSDNKSPQVSRTLLSILAVLNNAVVWMVSTRPPTSKPSSSFNNPLVTVPKAPITVGIIVTFMFHSFFNSLARTKYLSFFSHSFCFTMWSAGTAKSTILQVLFFLLIIIRSGRLAEIRWSVCMLKSYWSLCVSFSRYYYYYYHHYWLRVFHISVWRRFFHWSMRDSNFSQVFRTLLSILADLVNAVVWMVLPRPPIANSSMPLTRHLNIVPRAPIIIGITVTYML